MPATTPRTIELARNQPHEQEFSWESPANLEECDICIRIWANGSVRKVYSTNGGEVTIQSPTDFTLNLSKSCVNQILNMESPIYDAVAYVPDNGVVHITKGMFRELP